MNIEPDTQDRADTIRTFDAFLRVQENGALNEDLSAKLNEIVAGLESYVLDHGGKPEATLAVKIKFKRDGQHMSVTAAIDSKLPEPPREASVFYATRDNKLTKRDPRQREMFTDVAGSRRSDAVTA